MSRFPAALLAVAMTAVSLATPSAARVSHHATVTLDDMAFTAPATALSVGDRLTFANNDSFQHTATVQGQFDLDLKPGQSRDVVLQRAGTFEVTCRYHPTMKLKIVVQPAPAGIRPPPSQL